MKDKELLLEILEMQKSWDYLYGNGMLSLNVLVSYASGEPKENGIEYTSETIKQIENVKNNKYVLEKAILAQLFLNNKIIFHEHFKNSSEFCYWVEGIKLALPKRLKRKYFEKYLKRIL